MFDGDDCQQTVGIQLGKEAQQPAPPPLSMGVPGKQPRPCAFAPPLPAGQCHELSAETLPTVSAGSPASPYGDSPTVGNGSSSRRPSVRPSVPTQPLRRSISLAGAQALLEMDSLFGGGGGEGGEADGGGE